MVSWGGLGGLAPPGISVTRALPPGGGLGGFAPQESPLITRALPPQRPCLAPVPCPPFFSSEFVRPNFFARIARILMIFGPFEPRRRQLKFEKNSNERKIIESIESIDSIERSRDRSDRSTAAVLWGVIRWGQETHPRSVRKRVSSPKKTLAAPLIFSATPVAAPTLPYRVLICNSAHF